MIEVKEMLIDRSQWSRDGAPLKEVRAIVMHWTANPKAGARNNRDYFNNLPQMNRANIESGKSAVYASAHYVVGQDGEVVRCVPENERAFHCGTSAKDPKSGKVYTDYARERLGAYCAPGNSPNNCTIGVEMCPLDEEGNFSGATIAAAAELCADICKRHGLRPRDIMTHSAIVGWKDCPRLWVSRPELLDAFKQDVRRILEA